jgi:hypothetical protein
MSTYRPSPAARMGIGARKRTPSSSARSVKNCAVRSGPTTPGYFQRLTRARESVKAAAGGFRKKRPMAAIAGGHRAKLGLKLKIIVTRGNPSLAGLAATYSSKP